MSDENQRVPVQPKPNTTPVRDGGGLGVGFVFGIVMVLFAAGVLATMVKLLVCG